MEAKYHFTRQYVENGVLNIKFVKTAENYADIFTKNVSSSVFENLTDYLYSAMSLGAGWGVVASESGSESFHRFKN